jgi:hypothetical protein
VLPEKIAAAESGVTRDTGHVILVADFGCTSENYVSTFLGWIGGVATTAVGAWVSGRFHSYEADWMTLSAPSGRVDLVAVSTTKARKKGAEQC